jgi:membrane-bound serine protease (ClpP class)
MKKISLIGLIISMVCIAWDGFASDANKVLLLEYNGVIHGGTIEVVKQALDKARSEKAQCLIIELDTPGGTVDATREIVKIMLNSDLPIVVYVAPSGSRAGSAGTFITLAGHIAAMAPGTNIGAAHPVLMTGQDVEKEGGKTMAKKVEEDTAAFIESIANQRKRNVEWARKAVLESSSITNDKALEYKVIDLIAKDIPELLDKIDGREVTLKDSTVKLQTKGAAALKFEMDLKLRVLNFFASPTVLMFLIALLILGIYVEISHPGLILPAVIAGVALILILFSTQALPISFLGLMLVMGALVMIILELFATAHGFLAAAGIVCFILGSLLLFDPSKTDLRVPVDLIIGAAAGIAIVVGIILYLIIGILKKKPTTGWEGLIGTTAKVVERIEKGKQGRVFVNGEYWNARADTHIEADEEVLVTGAEHLLLEVKKKS